MFNLMVWRWCVFVFRHACPSAADYVGWNFVASTAKRKIIAANEGQQCRFSFPTAVYCSALGYHYNAARRTKRPAGFLSDDRSWSIIRLSSQAHWQLIYTQTALEVLEKLTQTRVPWQSGPTPHATRLIRINWPTNEMSTPIPSRFLNSS